MMQLIQKSFGNRPYRLHAGTTEFQLLKVFTIKGSNIFNQDKIAAAHQAKDHGVSLGWKGA
jgi:hypothetical protein